MVFVKGHSIENTGRTRFKKGIVPWNKGKRGLQTAWNKGISCSEETKNKIGLANSIANRGKVRTQGMRKHYSESKMGYKNPAKRKEVRRKISLSSKGRVFSEKTKAKLRMRRAKQQFPFNNTSIEVALQNILRENRIRFTTQKHELIGTPDIFIEPNICIFADGDYWHNRPEAKKKDRLVNERLEKEGYRVVRFWEHNIKNELNKCLDNILFTIKGEI